MKKAALYVRVSTQEQKQHGLSVDSQIEALTQYCKENDLEYYLYNDAGISAHVTYKKRPALLQLINDCQQGRIDIILFTRIDRFFRSIKDYYLVMDQISTPWKAIWEDYETETSSGQLKVNIMLSISEAEAARTSERIKSVMEHKRAQGHYLGTVPWGYKRINNFLVKDEDAAPYVDLMFKTYLETRSSIRTMQVLSDAGIHCQLKTLKSRLKNDIYIGEYLTTEEYEIINRDLSVKSRERPRTNHVYIYASLIRCGYCGHKLSGCCNKIGTDDNGETVRVWRYICHGCYPPTLHKSLGIKEDKLERILLQNLDRIIGEYHAQKVETTSMVKMVDVSKLRDKLKRVGIRFEDGDITVEEYREKRKQIQAEIRKAEALNRPLEPVTLPDNWKDIYNDLTPENRKAFWKSIIREITLTRENKNSLSGAIEFK